VAEKSTAENIRQTDHCNTCAIILAALSISITNNPDAFIKWLESENVDYLQTIFKRWATGTFKNENNGPNCNGPISGCSALEDLREPRFRKHRPVKQNTEAGGLIEIQVVTIIDLHVTKLIGTTTNTTKLL